MDRQKAVEDAARAVLEHGGPQCLTDPHVATDAMSRALDTDSIGLPHTAPDSATPYDG